MYCVPCRSERLGQSKQCAACGALLVARPTPVLSAELMHVLWVLEEVPRWDVSVVPATARAYVTGKYRQQERVLRGALGERVEPAPDELKRAPAKAEPDHVHPMRIHAARSGAEVAATRMSATVDESTTTARTPSTDEARARQSAKGQIDASAPQRSTHTSNSTGDVSSRAEVTRDAATPAAPPTVEPSHAAAALTSADVRDNPVAALLELAPSAPTPDDALVNEASPWHRVWKPFLHESVGWFVGGFLILVGTLYWVADAWASMSGTMRSLTVFAFAAAWTLGFAAWSRFLTRREATRGAGRTLELIAAALAPLAPLALGPIASSAPAFFWPALVAWSAFAFFVGRSVATAHDPEGGSWTAASMAMTAGLMERRAARLGLVFRAVARRRAARRVRGLCAQGPP